MTVALILLAAIIVTGLACWLYELHARRREAAAPSGAPSPEASAAEEECCGMHITCERDSLLTAVSPEIVYYDDEELDVYAGRGADDYTDEETEQFRDVLYTLLPDDIAGWGRSIQLRGITLPSVIKDELLLIVSEARAARNHA